jgi:hypothetical protein
MAIIEKREGTHARQTVGLLPYLFPSMAASNFDVEAPLRLEDVLRAYTSRNQLMMRIEDMLFLPYVGD